MREKIDVKKIKKREVSEKEILENEKEYKKKKIFLYIIPLIFIAIIIILYILTVNHFLLIPFAIFFLIFLYGFDSKQRTCHNCKKWNSLIWIDNKVIVRVTKTKKKLLKKEYEKKKREKITRSTGKCKNCGEETTTEKSKFF